MKKMKRFLLFECAVMLMLPLWAKDEVVVDKSQCTVTKEGKSFPLYGKVQIVENFPDIKVQIVESFADVEVQLVESFPDDCGKVKLVEHFPDVKVQIVEHFPDIKVKVVNAFPGVKK